MIAQILVHEETLLAEESLVGRFAMCQETTHADGRNLDELGSRLQTVVHAALCAIYVDAFDVVVLGEVFHDGGTVEHRVNLDGGTVEQRTDVVGDVAIDDAEASALEEVAIGRGEIVIQERLQATFSILWTLGTYQTGDTLGIGTDELVEQVNAQIASGSRQEYMT